MARLNAGTRANRSMGSWGISHQKLVLAGEVRYATTEDTLTESPRKAGTAQMNPITKQVEVHCRF